MGQLRFVYVRCLTKGPEQMFLLNNSNCESIGWKVELQEYAWSQGLRDIGHNIKYEKLGDMQG